MSYLVLARKWRPRRFAELVGQEHVVRALTHALDSGRIHHAFLFTGTRGVGKTTIARIFAKSLNCETGVGAEPCGKCAVCEAVDAGRFVDLIEIDAASNTGVDDVREVIENAQYMPTRGRYKVYLVDEVHMLSRNAFNALLKTLEEPPEHVKFLLATTDPQKLPVTVLSRCLQFNLKRLTPEQIESQLERILSAEGIDHEAGCTALLSAAADGSLRDALSLLDQAIAHGGGTLRRNDVATMIGSVDAADLGALLGALAGEDGSALLAAIEHLATYSPDYSGLLAELAAALHGVQVRQLVPAAVGPSASDVEMALAERPPELVQLWYQMAVLGRREIDQAPTPRIGFEMVLLRMLAFGAEPGDAPRRSGGQSADGARKAAAEVAARIGKSDTSARASVGPALAQDRVSDSVRKDPPSNPEARPETVGRDPVRSFDEAPAAITKGTASRVAEEVKRPVQERRRVADAEDWLGVVESLSLRGPVVPLAQQLAFASDDGDALRLALPASLDHLRAPSLIESLSEAVSGALGGNVVLRIEARSSGSDTLAQRRQRERDQRQLDAEEAFVSHPVVGQLLNKHGGQVVADSVRPRQA